MSVYQFATDESHMFWPKSQLFFLIVKSVAKLCQGAGLTQFATDYIIMNISCLQTICAYIDMPWHTENTLMLNDLYVSLYCFCFLFASKLQEYYQPSLFFLLSWIAQKTVQILFCPYFNHTVEIFVFIILT